MPEIEKQCLICGKSCAGHPRVKNEKGQYAHRACIEAKEAAKQQAEHADPDLAALGFDDDEAFADMGDMLDDMPAESVSTGLQSACPSCGGSLAPGTVVCMNCGYNSESGKALKTKSKNQTNATGSAVAGIAGKAGKGALTPFLPVIGAAIAGFIGAAIWAAIAYFAGYELGILAWAIGGLVGVGALIGARGDGNLWVGCVAAVIAVASILGGKYAVVAIMINEAYGDVGDFHADETWVLQQIVDEIAYDWQEEGKRINWPQRGMSIDEAEWPSDYPEDLQAAARASWDEYTPDEKANQIDMIERQAKAGFQMIRNEDLKQGFISTFGMFDLVWLFFALFTAYGIGAQED